MRSGLVLGHDPGPVLRRERATERPRRRIDRYPVHTDRLMTPSLRRAGLVVLTRLTPVTPYKGWTRGSGMAQYSLT